MDAGCDKPIIDNHDGGFHIINNMDSIIVNSFLIASILSSWKDLSSKLQENEVLELFLSALLALTRDDHPYREFNVAQLNRVKLIQCLLSFCKVNIN